MDFESDSDVTIKLKKAKAERRAHVKKKKNKEGRNIKNRDSLKKQRLTTLKESYKEPQPNIEGKDWDDVAKQEQWESLTNRERINLSRAQSHSVESLVKKITQMAEKYNASVNITIRFPNGSQQSKYHLASGGGIPYSMSADGQLTKELWEHHFSIIQKKRMGSLTRAKLFGDGDGDIRIHRKNPEKILEKRMADVSARE